MKRVKYVRDSLIYSPLFLLGTIQLQIVINPDTFQYSILDVTNNEILHNGACNSIRMCKVNAKTILKKYGVIFEEEQRSVTERTTP